MKFRGIYNFIVLIGLLTSSCAGLPNKKYVPLPQIKKIIVLPDLKYQKICTNKIIIPIIYLHKGKWNRSFFSLSLKNKEKVKVSSISKSKSFFVISTVKAEAEENLSEFTNFYKSYRVFIGKKDSVLTSVDNFQSGFGILSPDSKYLVYYRKVSPYKKSFKRIVQKDEEKKYLLIPSPEDFQLV